MKATNTNQWSTRAVAILSAVVLGVMLGSCGSSEEAKDKTDDGLSTGREAPVAPPINFVNLELAPQAPMVATVQLYRGTLEASLPVLPMRPLEKLTLEFDLLERDGRPLRVEFRRANRYWQDDFLNSTLYLTSQSGDAVLSYNESTAQASDYVHYRYTFPNDVIGFKTSGNYILTVLDPRRAEPILFERPFVVTEESAEALFELRGVPIPGAGGVWNQPYLFVDPGNESDRDIFDYSACFVKNVRFDLGRCSTRPSLFDAPYISFFLEPQASFEPEPDLHLVDIGELRSGIGIEEIYFDVEPYALNLVPDLADMGSPEPTIQNGQSVIREAVTDVTDPAYQAEYVVANFTYIPFRERRASGRIVIQGSFNGWILDERNSLTWFEEDKRYRGSILLKQGAHAYQYVIAGSRPPSQGAFAPESTYSALLYYFDPILNTDRLVAHRTVLAP